MKTRRVKLKTKARAEARYHLKVVDAETGEVVKDLGEKKNLLMVTPQDYFAYGKWMQECYVGTGTTPNKETLDGTYQQAGDTVTRASGTGVFSSDNVNDFVKFGTGERARIINYVNTLTVEVDREQTVSASSLTVYNTSRTALDNQVKSTTTSSGVTEETGSIQDTEAGSITYFKTFNFSTETQAATYQEVGFGNNESAYQDVIFGRLVLDSPASVGAGQFLQVKITMIWTLGNFRTATPIEVDIDGWPREYGINSIVANGTSFDVELDDVHHYQVGGKINIEGALPEGVAITDITSNASEFTVTTTADHGFSAADVIEIDGSSIAGYDGAWTVAAITSSTVFTVASSSNLGTATGGEVRPETPGTWFDGEWTIASLPSSDTVRITSSINPPDAGSSGVAYNNLNAEGIISGSAFSTSVTNQINGGVVEPFGREQKRLYVVSGANMQTGMQYGVNLSAPTSIGSTLSTNNETTGYDSATLSRTDTFDFASGEVISDDVRQFYFLADNGGLWVTFEEPQQKLNGYTLSVELVTSWEPSLD